MKISVWDRIDKESRPPLEALLKAFPGGLNKIPDLLARREALSNLRAALPRADFPQLDVIDYVNTNADDELTLRLYKPKLAKETSAGLIYVHGGGMIMGDLDSQDEFLRAMTTTLCIPVASVDYRKAPEHPYPAAPNDCYSAVCWVFDNSKMLGMEPNNIGLMGASAGGGLALATALMLRDRNGPALQYIISLYPMIDDRHTTPSSKQIVDIGVWDREGSIEAWNWYISNADPDSYAAPTRALDLRDLPRTYMDVGELDLFRDEDLLFAQRLAQAGVSIEFHIWPGAYHCSEFFAPDAALSKQIWATRYAAIRRLANI